MEWKQSSRAIWLQEKKLSLKKPCVTQLSKVQTNTIQAQKPRWEVWKLRVIQQEMEQKQGREAISIDQQRWIVVGPQRRKKYIVEALNNLRDEEDEDEDDMEVKQFVNVLVCGGI